MIFDTIIAIIYVFIWGITKVFTLLPDVTASSTIVGAFLTANAYLAPVSSFLDTLTIVFVFGFSVTFELGYLTYKGLNWIIRKIPGIS